MAQFRDLSSIYDMDEEGDERNARRILEQVSRLGNIRLSSHSVDYLK